MTARDALLRALAGPDWVEQAACRGLNTELFFPGRGEDVREAKAVCAACPVARQCLDYAVVNVEKFGIFGGKSERERRPLRRQMPKPTPTAADTKWCPDCGTYRPVDAFYLRRTGVKAGELSAYCKTHNGQRTTEYARRRRQGAA